VIGAFAVFGRVPKWGWLHDRVAEWWGTGFVMAWAEAGVVVLVLVGGAVAARAQMPVSGKNSTGVNCRWRAHADGATPSIPGNTRIEPDTGLTSWGRVVVAGAAIQLVLP